MLNVVFASDNDYIPFLGVAITFLIIVIYQTFYINVSSHLS